MSYAPNLEMAPSNQADFGDFKLLISISKRLSHRAQFKRQTHSPGSFFRIIRAMAIAASGLWLAFGTLSAQAQITVPTDYRNYAIIGGSTVNFDAYSAVQGDVYSAGDMTLGFGYGIQRPSINSGNFYTRGNFTLDSLFGETANVAANGNITVTSGSSITGNVQYGGTVSGSISGTKTQIANSVPVVGLPTIPAFTAGTQNVSSSGSVVLQPGSYGDVNLSSASSLTLSSGDYFLKSFTSGIGTLNLNITNGPIRVYSVGDISFTCYVNVNVNGVAIDYNASTPQAVWQAVCCLRATIMSASV